VITVNRPKNPSHAILINDIIDMGWYSYADNSAIFYGNREKRIQFSSKGGSALYIIEGVSEDRFYAYPIEVDVVINIK
jgi:hypothetical protein